jgi:aryl-alcohol dehydrogenase-like predicted oxidoreductase
MKIAIGTVQFGLDYGVANQAGRVPFDEVQKILEIASARAIDTLDTAIAYGDSESMLGQAGVFEWKVVTKLSAVPMDCVDVAGWVYSQVESSLIRLGINRLHSVLLHRPEQLLGDTGDQLFNALQYIKAQGLAKKIGVSIYAPHQLDRLTRTMDFDMVQAPLNILDRRLIESGWASRLKARGVELHVRSAFLQGLLLLRSYRRPSKFSRWQSVWIEWERWLAETGLTPLQACLAYVLGVEDVDKVVLGVDSSQQLIEILGSARPPLLNFPNWPQPIDSNLIDPSQWSKL